MHAMSSPGKCLRHELRFGMLSFALPCHASGQVDGPVPWR
jgi:hypothetical protein